MDASSAGPARLFHVTSDEASLEIRAAFEDSDLDCEIQQATVVGAIDSEPALFEDQRAFDCLVCDGATDPERCLDLLETVQSGPEAPPIVVYATTPRASFVDAAYDHGVAEVVLLQPDRDTAGLLPRRVIEAIERHQETLSARRDQSKLDTLFEDLPTFLYFKDIKARYSRIPPAAYHYERFLGRTDLELYVDEIGQPLYGDDRHVLRTGEPIINQEDSYPHPLELGDQWVADSKVPWRNDDGEIIGIVGITYNITGEKEQELELARQNDRLEEFASVVSEDLRNPLTVARGNLDLMRDTGDVERASDVAEALEKMESLIQDILALARLGTTVEAVHTIELADAVKQAWADVETETATLDIELAADRTIDADPDRLDTLLRNVLSNAVETGAQTVTVEIMDDGFAIADDGPGIDADGQESVFEHGYSTIDSGSGLGLSIVRRIVQAHDWSISAGESRTGGARFEISGVETIRRDRTDRSDAEPVSIRAGEDCGTVAEPGESTIRQSDTVFSVTGAGDNIWQRTNEFQFVYTTLDGDGEFSARVTGIENGIHQSKAGIMIRDRLSRHSAHAYVGLLKSTGSEFLWSKRASTATLDTQQDDGVHAPHYYKLSREGDELTGFVSGDGETWEAVQTETIPMEQTVYVGLVSCSTSPGEPSTATFDSVSGLESWENEDIGFVDVAGSTQIQPRTWCRIEAAGAGPRGNPPGYHFSSGAVGATQVELLAHVTTLDSSSAAARAGVGIAESTAVDGSLAALVTGPDGTVEFWWRADTDTDVEQVEIALPEDDDYSPSGSSGDSTRPCWLKIERHDEEVRGFVSVDGTNWVAVAEATVTLGHSARAGVLAWSGDSSSALAEFDTVNGVQYQ